MRRKKRSGATSAFAVFTQNIKTKRRFLGVTKGGEEKGKKFGKEKKEKAHRFLRLAGTVDATPGASFAEEKKEAARRPLLRFSLKTSKQSEGSLV